MGKKLTIFLVDGSETGPRTIEIGNWSGKAVYSQRSSLPKIIERQEFNRPGVYILKSMPNNDSYNERMYIGEAENLRKRLKQHLADSDRDFTEIVAFISKDEMLTKSHIKYLESRIITLAKEAKTAEIDNTVQPELTTLPEADISDMEYFLDQIKLIFPVVNFMFLVPSTLKQSENATVLEQPSNNSEMVYTVNSKKVAAKLIETEKGYVVLSGSQSSKTTSNSISEGWIKQRNKLIETGVLIDGGEFYIFKDNAIFSSISAATAVVLGRQAAGPVEWVDPAGRTFKQNQEKKFEGELNEEN
ncbi:methionine sulfoxide reductase [Paenibacillus lautus]|uniref:GIY-YIG nuclease family protein n=1 Tax=Paenibacillus lautus TaxID=1401 RepID=UPI001AFFC660|nr:GIY-YIG nuclease family protein [Paenibacillus lautus]GIO97170.1 methionine sulfoxide reductase [Paenibacillus lautus]